MPACWQLTGPWRHQFISGSGKCRSTTGVVASTAAVVSRRSCELHYTSLVGLLTADIRPATLPMTDGTASDSAAQRLCDSDADRRCAAIRRESAALEAMAAEVVRAGDSYAMEDVPSMLAYWCVRPHIRPAGIGGRAGRWHAAHMALSLLARRRALQRRGARSRPDG